MFPKYREVRIPLLAELARRGGASRPSDLDEQGRTIAEALADHFALPDSVRAVTIWDELAGIHRAKWANLVRWVRSDLAKLGYLYTPEKGVWALTEAGRAQLDGVESETVHPTSVGGRVVDPETFEKRQREAERVGRLGERYVLDLEVRTLHEHGCVELAARVEHVAARNVAAGYDVLSFQPDGRPKHIEVKASLYDYFGFKWTSNEKRTADRLGDAYWIYRVLRVESGSPLVVPIQDPARFVNQSTLLLRPDGYAVTAGEGFTLY